MAHDAATYTPTAVSFETPAETKARVDAEVPAAAEQYNRSAVTSNEQYLFLTGYEQPTQPE